MDKFGPMIHLWEGSVINVHKKLREEVAFDRIIELYTKEKLNDGEKNSYKPYTFSRESRMKKKYHTDESICQLFSI